MSSQSLEELKNAGLKATISRVKILELFHGSSVDHLSVEEVHRQLTAEGMDIGLATVYRVLAQFEAAGIVIKSTFDATKVIYELNNGPHHDHIVCLGCGRVDEFHDPVIEARQKMAAESLGYMMSEHQLSLYGYCRDCRPKPHKA
ncbi:ferric iron uptake transcriptional regulator [Herbaspirillum rubrisubalbicans]|uniref:Ferric uptake regulation protein n=1 Tax=Herbaspirillum rubrisubalbicans TaxID=80842 RepID=A0AAD0U9W1_9BURK|nr:ferric iron uptake transcriptional regulator [Herbaspirillum rubrisubalbicans]AYR24492.1 ferric iron uptake transcriptional regulator [Herbaspirillum rubrisubalbicans]